VWIEIGVDGCRDDVRGREICAVFKRLVFEPEDINIKGLVAFYQLVADCKGRCPL
jgi:hypothetical protein